MTKIGRNDDCPCGKKKPDGITPMKYKKCCESKDAAILIEQKQKMEKEADDKWRRKFWSHKPYTLCPQCKEMTFGRSGVNSRGYTKECYECGHTERYPLPELKKKIIYLDQFVIDNFVKTLDPTHPKHKKVSENPFWLEAYKKLDVLSKAQLIVCPDSFFHQEESAPTGYFESMQRVYEHLSGGATFYDEPRILQSQMRKHFRNYVRNKPNDFPDVDPSEIVIGELNEWHDWMRISVSSQPKKEDVEEKMKAKEKSYTENFLPIFERWKTEKGRKFEDRCREETKGFVTGTIQVIGRYAKRQAELPQKIQNGGQIDMDDVFPPPSMELVTSLTRIAQEEGINDSQKALIKVGEYFNSSYLDVVPSMRITSALYAVIADQAANGRVSPQSPGVQVDVQMISSFLPYCDAMFIDNENTAFLQDGRVKAKIGYPTKMFSLRNKEEFLQHLDDILASADSKHMALIKRIYGDDHLQPYTTILEYKD